MTDTTTTTPPVTSEKIETTTTTTTKTDILTNVWFWIAIGLVGTFVVGLGLWFLMNRGSNIANVVSKGGGSFFAPIGASMGAAISPNDVLGVF